MSRIRRASILVALGLSLLPRAADADGPLTTKQMEALPPQSANQKVRRDLLSVLMPVRRISSGMLRRLHGVWLQTRPFGTAFEGVCRLDDVTLWYAPTTNEMRPEDTPVQPYSIEAQPLFHIIRLPKAKTSNGRDDQLVWQSACERLDRDDTVWFAAKDAFHAVQGAFVLEKALEDVKGGELKVAPCPNIRDAKLTCEEAILAVGDLSKVNTIETCTAADKILCYAFDIDTSTKLTITARRDHDSLMPEDILSIDIERYIVVS
jgi:hypothetical protein